MISKKFLENTKDKAPNRVLLEALPYVKTIGRALDLGCGAFRDTMFLAEKGFVVDAVDSSPDVSVYLPENDAIHFSAVSFSDFPYPENEYDLVTAQYSLPFCEPEKFPDVWQKIITSLKKGGIFTGQFFGYEDGFAPNAQMTFLNKEHVEELFSDCIVHTFVEAKRTKKTATGREKFWHIFDVIAEKK